ncbi:MAG: prepilin-type N-terminal cleavage/methylation domain-containing protein [Lachnospiraceae bacterium]|nr:prepilin-type N-terminal cleavage/methylation domain-containing protein [Lachnospiraceae bacterium]
MRKDHKGFTLIELVVVIAIIGIVLVSLVGFMVTGTKSYAAASTEVDIQKEAQITMNQIEDLIIDTTKVVTYTYQADPTDSEHMVIKDADMPSSPYSKRLCMYNGAVAYEITWKNDGKNQLYYAEYSVVSGAKTGTATEYLMSDYVTNFQADLTNLQEKRVVQMNVDFNNQGRSFQSSNNVTIRNKVVVNNLSHYENPVIPTGTVTNITAQGPVYLAPNESYTFLKPLIIGTGVPSQEVTWEFENTGDHDANTTVDSNGTIHISRTETHETFRVKATSVADTSKSAFIIVNLIRVNDVTIADTSVGTSKYIPSKAFGLKTTVDSYHIDKDPTGNGDSCTWEITEGSAYMDDLGVDSYGVHQYRIKSSTAVGTKIIVKATSNHSTHWNYPNDSHIFGIKEIIVQATPPEVGVDHFTIGKEANPALYIDPKEPSFAAGNGYYFYVKIEKSDPGKEEWTVVNHTKFNYLGKNDVYGGGDPKYPDYYYYWNSGNHVDFRIPNDLSLDYDYLFTFFYHKTNGTDSYYSKTWAELIPKTEIVYNCSNKIGLATDADHISMHSYAYDTDYRSKTYLPPSGENNGNGVSMTITTKNKSFDGYENILGRLQMVIQESNNCIYFKEKNRLCLRSWIEKGTLKYYPTFEYNGDTYLRPENFVEWTIDYGNIKIGETELFLPYPSHPTFLENYASENVGETKIVGYQYLKSGTNYYRLYILSTKQSDGSYIVKLKEKSYSWNSYGSYKCSADGTVWEEIK